MLTPAQLVLLVGGAEDVRRKDLRAQEMASQPSRPRRNVSPASSKHQPLRAVYPFSLLRNPSPTRGNPIRRSPSSSPIHNAENAFKPRRNSPETRGSPEHRRSPTSPSLLPKVEKPKPLRAGGIKRTSSLDAISGTYLSGQWPRDGGSCGVPCCHKATQTPAWDEGKGDDISARHKRSNSLGSADLKEKLKQNIQRKKQEKKSSVAYGRQSPVHGDHSAIQHKTQSLAIPIPTISRPTEVPQRRSVEALNSEIQTLVNKSDGIATDKVLDPIDGRKAPVQEILSDNSPFNTVDTQTQTPSENVDSQGSASSGNNGSRSHSASPTYPIMPGTIDYQPNSRCSSSGGINDTATNDADNQESGGSPEPAGIPKYASSPKPNNTYLFAREPPDGAEKVQLHVEDIDSDSERQFTGPDKTKVKFMLSHASAFSALPSYPSMAIKPAVGLVSVHTSLEASQ